MMRDNSMKHVMAILVRLVFVLMLTQCASPSYTLPYAQIPQKAWRPGDVGEVKTPLYAYKGSDFHCLQDIRSFSLNEICPPEEYEAFDILSMLQSGEWIKITECRRYPMSTVDGLEVRGVVIQGRTPA